MYKALGTIAVSVFLIGCGKSQPQVVSPAQAPTSKAADPKALQGQTIDWVLFVGNARVPDARLRAMVKSRVGTALDPARLRSDVRSLYAIQDVDDVRVLGERSGSRVRITFRIREAKLVSSVAFRGATVLGHDVLGETAAVEVGKPLEPWRVTAAASALARLYREQGHFGAEATWRARKTGDTIEILFTVKEGAKGQIVRVDFPGAKSVKRPELTNLFADQSGANKIGGIYRKDVADKGRLRLLAEYYERGYINAKVGPHNVQATGDKVSVVVPIHEGDAFRIGKVSITGIPDRSANSYRKLLSIRTGQLFQRSKVGESIQNVAKFYRDKVNSDAEVTPLTKVDADAKIVDIELKIASK